MFDMNEQADKSAGHLMEQLPNDVQSEIYGIGIDIASVERMKLAIERSGEVFLNRVFTINEQSYAQDSEIMYERYAACWAMKEAAVKALGTGFRYDISFKDIELIKEKDGKPAIATKGRFQEVMQEKCVVKAHLSLSHISSYAIATVLLCKK